MDYFIFYLFVLCVIFLLYLFTVGCRIHAFNNYLKKSKNKANDIIKKSELAFNQRNVYLKEIEKLDSNSQECSNYQFKVLKHTFELDLLEEEGKELVEDYELTTKEDFRFKFWVYTGLFPRKNLKTQYTIKEFLNT